MANKKKITLFVDEEIWKEFNQVLKEKGYPRGVPSWLAQQTFERTTIELQYATSTQLDLFFNRKD